MNVFFDMLDPRPFWKSDYTRPTIMLLCASVLPVLHFYLGSIHFASTVLTLNEHFSVQYMFLTALLLFGLIPTVLIRIFGEKLSDYGLKLGDWKTGLKFIAVAYPFVAICLLLPGAFTPELQAFYPFDKAAHHSVGALVNLELTRLIFFYSAWELFFRGFLLFGLRRYVGDWFAILIQVIPSCLWHLGMPASEIASSILAGVAFGMLTLRTGSFLWALLIHFLIGTGMDVFIVLFS